MDIGFAVDSIIHEYALLAGVAHDVSTLPSPSEPHVEAVPAHSSHGAESSHDWHISQ